MSAPKFTNSLINETSPYLLQHAHNPVNWEAWNSKSLEKSRKEDKLLLISVGYSACHWCHVMEHESFEDEAVAEIMNAHFINIKVDREERPDIDQVYMNAVQIMTGAGGWPMNIVALPDGRPVWGGTYFRKEQWKDALKQLSGLYKTKPDEMKEYASRLEKGLQQLQLIEIPEEETPFSTDFLNEILEKWKKGFDKKNGGSQGAPKFMLPVNQEFLLRSGVQLKDQDLLEHSLHSLNKISYGGVFDHIGGGFSRYSVDERWHVPHFEKMLYDNAQLVSLYSDAFSLTKDNWYKEVVLKTLEFVNDELTDTTGAFYSALDADSEDKNRNKTEGAYYVWKKEELQALIKEDFKIFEAYYNINSFGKWEENNYVLIRSKNDKTIAETFNIRHTELQSKKENWIKILKKERDKRTKPGLDDKSLTSWNALMLNGYIDAYKAFNTQEFLEKALKNAEFLQKHQFKKDFRLWHNFKNGKSSINAYLEDYVFCTEAFLNLYEATFEEKWLEIAEHLISVCFEDFQDKNTGLFYFTSSKDEALITRTYELNDNVMPASNSVMAKNLFKVAKITGNRDYYDLAARMLKTVQPQIKTYPQSYANWLDLVLNFTETFYEIAITGKNAHSIKKELQQEFLPNTIFAGSKGASEISLLKNRFKENQDLIYICSDGKCDLPLNSVEDSIKKMKHF
ncbi:thioredoxin domain-containing protein [Salegentibacter sp. JZCK2]|uniref:thioredoxin domain-containing protein n=1 Tax=Salegentibacter tibetensis TaxID=2873600 RepID=UPI001CC9742C|nr:thioredoxin domain-containing protein [Salegentibacter tibetensis]MBZ9729535.1 thioredoxin domain-containing protein [Salegentibacter tibetensis]